MGKVEIKIRKKILTPDNLQQYRNYPALLKKYERNKRFKRALRIFIYSLALTIFVLSLVFLGFWKILLDKKQETGIQSGTALYLKSYNGKSDTVRLELLSNRTLDSMHVVTYKGQNGRPDDVFELPTSLYSNGQSSYRLIEDKKITIENRTYTIKKYLYDVGHPVNRNYYFYCQEYGILIFASSWHENFYLHHVGSTQNSKIITDLIKEIRADVQFDYW